MRRPQHRMISFTAYLAFGVAAWICLGVISRADDGAEVQSSSDAVQVDSSGGEITDSATVVGDVVDSDGGLSLGGDEVGTADSAELKGAAALQRSLGRRRYFESLSAINLQKALDASLDNRRERIDSYYQMRELRDEQVRDETTITQEQAVRIAQEKAPARLTSQDYDPETGEIFWPDPLDDKVLKPYTRLIDEKFALRSDVGKTYRGSDARMVRRMVNLIQTAIDSIKNDLPVREYIALSDYLASISYEASFDAAGNRIIDK